jgi:hypothetical protein
MSDASQTSSRRALFLAFCAFFVALAATYILRNGGANGPPDGALEGPFIETLAGVDTGSGLLFASSAFDRTNGHVAFESPAASESRPSLTRLRCERVHFRHAAGICLSADRGFLTTYAAQVFGPDFRVRSTIPLQGPPSRARVSPDGRRAAATVFVTGDSYASASFSTRTTLLDVETGRVIADLEEFSVSRSGIPFKAIDFNFWGVTFAQDSNRFFATLRSGGTIYLVEGDVRAQSATVIREGVECPSLSPDNKSVVFKSRVGASQWRLHLLDLTTLRDTPLVETRSVDDQVEWLDDDSIAYALLARNGSTGGSDIWTLNVRSEAPPTVLIQNGYSPAAIR